MTIQSSSPNDVGDVDIQFIPNRYPVNPGPDLLTTGWRGGQWVMYVPGAQDFTVEASDGTAACGYLMFQSENYGLTRPRGTGPGSPENWISHQFLSGRGGQNVATMLSGGTRVFFKMYETAALVGGVRSTTPAVYVEGEDLKVSENGLLCNDGDVQLALVGVTSPIRVGIVSAVPSARNGYRLCLDCQYG